MFRRFLYGAAALWLLAGCAPQQTVSLPELPKTNLQPSSFEALEGWNDERYGEALALFRKNCRTSAARRLYGELCEAEVASWEAKSFFRRAFTPYRIVDKSGGGSGVMTGYYEPLLHGSRTPDARYRYPLYGEPDDLLEIDLGALDPALKNRRLRGRLVGDRVVPYYARSDIEKADAPVLCWVDDRIALFFLEVQGSGRIALDDGDILYVGYANQNGHRYRSVGKYLIDRGELTFDAVSLQSIRAWLNAHPDRVDEVLNYNQSVVFFRVKQRPATGSLGLVLTPERSVAVDRRYIPLGAMLFVEAEDPLEATPLDRIVFAQDTGGAIKGALRADFFWGYGREAERKAGKMVADTAFWILLPKASAKGILR